MSRAHFAWLPVAAYVLGCGAHDFQARVNTLVARGAYAEAVTATRREPELEKALASAVLKQAARSNDAERRRRAFAELQLAGTRGRSVLQDLTRSSEPVTRALAYSALWSLGDSTARDALAPLATDADPELAALGYSALDADADRPLLMAALTEPNHARRSAAVRVLGKAEAEPEIQTALESVAKLDPEADVRAAAVAALGRYGAGAEPALVRALDDAAESVRFSAIAALTHVASESALARLARDLGAAPTPETLTAAASLLRLTPPREVDRARGVLERALSSAE
ncbi:MAG TPA: HEAT repeat domain-containing protein, partial [Polyangiales bacterium]|nr:HEAT repeat domain-containing protein [Polyangiales bacterium]